MKTTLRKRFILLLFIILSSALCSCVSYETEETPDYPITSNIDFHFYQIDPSSPLPKEISTWVDTTVRANREQDEPSMEVLDYAGNTYVLIFAALRSQSGNEIILHQIIEENSSIQILAELKSLKIAPDAREKPSILIALPQTQLPIEVTWIEESPQ